MKSPFLYHSQRSALAARLEFLCILAASALWIALASRTLSPLVGLSSPLALVCCWSLLRLTLPGCLLVSLFLASCLDQIYGQPLGLLIPCHLCATALTRWIQLPMNLPFAWIFPIHLALWSFFYDTSWQAFSLLNHQASLSPIQIYQLPLLAIKDGLLALFSVTLPLLGLPKSQATSSTL